MLGTHEEEGISIRIRTPYTLKSNGFAEHMHQTILGNARVCVAQVHLPSKYWNFAERHVADCRNYIKNEATGRITHEDPFGTKPRNLTHLLPLGCLLVYRPPSSRLKYFDYCGCDGSCFYHEGGGAHYVFADDRIIRTKHVRKREQTFPGLSLFMRHEHRR